MALAQNLSWPKVGLQFDTINGPNTSVRSWRSFTKDNRLRDPSGQGVSCSFGRQYELNQNETGTATIPLANKDEYLNPQNVNSPYNSPFWQFIQRGDAATNTTTLSVNWPTPVTPGSLLVMVACSSGTLTAPVDPWGNAWTQQIFVNNNAKLYVWSTVATGLETIQTVTSSVACATGLLLGFAGGLGAVNVSATSFQNAGSYTSATTGTTATTPGSDWVVACIGTRGFASASPPTTPTWNHFYGYGTTKSSQPTTSATSTQNNMVHMTVGTTGAGTQSNSLTWTNAVTDTAGAVLTFTRATSSLQLLQPTSLSQALVPMRPIRQFAMWPSTAAGNLLNSTNDPWSAAYYPTGNPPAGGGASYADTAGFEGGTVGTWLPGSGVAAPANSAVRAHDGTKSMLVTWPTAGSGVARVYTDLPPVDTNDQVTFSAWVYVPTGGSPAVALKWNGTTGTASAVTNAWTQISVTVTRADGGLALGGTDVPDVLYLSTAGASTSGQQVWVDSVQMELAASPSAFQTTGSTVYPVFSHYIERYPELWTHNGYHGWTRMVSTDALANMAAITLQDCMTEDIQQDLPVIYIPFTQDAATSQYPAYQSIYNIRSVGPTANGSFFYQFGAANGPGLDSTTCAAFTPGTGNSMFRITALWGLSSGASCSLECWVKSVAVTPTSTIAAAATGNKRLVIDFNASGQLEARYTANAGSTWDYTITDWGTSNDGNWHHVVATESYSAGTVTGTLYVDGRQVAQATRSDTNALLPDSIYLGSDPNAVLGWFSGWLSRVAFYSQALTAARVKSHYASSLGFPWDTGGQRIARILAWMPWSSATNIDVGITRVSPSAGYSGKSVLAAIQDAALAENSPFFTSPYGVPTFFHRDRYYTQTTSKYTFGELENAYQANISTSTDITYLYNLVEVTGFTGAVQAASDGPSQNLYLPRVLPKQTTQRVDYDAMQLARHWLNTYRQPRPRLANLEISPAKDGDGLWVTGLGAKFGDRATFVRRTQAGTIQFDGFIDRVEHAQSVNEWITKFQVSPVEATQAMILGDATYGVLGGTATVKF